MIGQYPGMTKATPDEATKESVASEDVAALTLQLEQLKTERDYLLAHSRNLEDELRHLAREPTRVRELEQRLAETEARLRTVSVVHARRWLGLEPDAAPPPVS